MIDNPYQVYASTVDMHPIRIVRQLANDYLFCRTLNGEAKTISVEFFPKYYYPVTRCVSCDNELHNEDVTDGDWIDQEKCLWICVNCCCCLSCHHICWKYDTYSKCECPATCSRLTHSKPEDTSIRTHLNELLNAAQDLRIIQVQILGLIDDRNAAWRSDADRAWKEINQAHRALYMKLLGGE